MREIGAFEAKNKLGQLLDRVEAGEEILITRRGRPWRGWSPLACSPTAKGPQGRRRHPRHEPRRHARRTQAERPGGGRALVSVVIDASLTLAWYFEDERTPAIDAVLDRVANEGGLAPSLWRLEVANGFRMAIRRKRVDAAFRDRALAHLGELPV